MEVCTIEGLLQVTIAFKFKVKATISVVNNRFLVRLENSSEWKSALLAVKCTTIEPSQLGRLFQLVAPLTRPSMHMMVGIEEHNAFCTGIIATVKLLVSKNSTIRNYGLLYFCNKMTVL